MESYKELTVWRKGIYLAKLVYNITRQLPTEEKYALGSQMQRASISIPSNIAEGWRRKSHKEYAQFLRIAFGSAAELETQLILLKDLYPSTHNREASKVVEEIQKMLNVLIKKIDI